MPLRDGQGFARLVTLDNLENFAPLLQRISGSGGEGGTGGTGQRRRQPPDPEMEAAENLFGGNSIRVPLPRTIYRPRRPPRRRPEEVVQPVILEIASVDNRGSLVWRKINLPASDVQRQPGNPTGGLRLTQAKFRAEDGIIDQTTYFREILFGRFTWTIKRQAPFVESTMVNFDIAILGRLYGVHALEISHKPSGVASQGNYTTILHWGDMAGTIRDLNLVGRIFSIYGPEEGTTEPFFIEIT